MSNPGMNNVLHCKAIVKTFKQGSNDVPVLKSIDFHVAKGETIAIGALIAAPAVQPTLAFGAVDQIGESESTRSTPRRRPRTDQNTSAQTSEPLVFIETAVDKVQPAALVEEQAPRRRTPRARKPRETFNEPLVVVETQPSQSPPSQV